MTNLAEATADPVLELDAVGNPVAAASAILEVAGAVEGEEGAVGGVMVLPHASPDPLPSQ